MGLCDDLLRGIYGYGFERPSAIQQRAIKPLMKGAYNSFLIVLYFAFVVCLLHCGDIF